MSHLVCIFVNSLRFLSGGNHQGRLRAHTTTACSPRVCAAAMHTHSQQACAAHRTPWPAQCTAAPAAPARPCGQRHPFLFTLMTLTAAAELGLTAFLIGAGSQGSSSGYRSLLVLLCFESVWTLLFAAGYLLWVMEGGARLLASVASSAMWLLLTAVLWGAAAGVMHNTRGTAHCPLPRCRQSQTIEALGWTEFTLCALTLLSTVLWMTTGVQVRGHMRDSRTLV